jgi:hypothetical protein
VIERSKLEALLEQMDKSVKAAQEQIEKWSLEALRREGAAAVLRTILAKEEECGQQGDSDEPK